LKLNPSGTLGGACKLGSAFFCAQPARLPTLTEAPAIRQERHVFPARRAASPILGDDYQI